MSAQTGQVDRKADLLKWLIVIVLAVVAVVANTHWTGQFLLARVVGIVVLAGVAGGIAVQTRQGGVFLDMLREARAEALRVVWPQREETWQTALLVLAVVAAMSLILWGADALFGWIIRSIIG